MHRSLFLALLGSTCATPLPARAQGDRLAAIRARGTLRIGLTGDYEPYSYIAPDGTWSGLAFVDNRIHQWNDDGTYAGWRTMWLGSDLNAPRPDGVRR